MRMWIRVGAGVLLGILVWWVAASGYWEIGLLIAIGAGLGAVVARPKRPAAYKPVYWSRRDLGA